MAEPFEPKPLVRQSIIEEIAGIHLKQNAIIEINNALAKAENIRQVSLEDIRHIASIYKVHSPKELQKDLGSLYHDYLKCCLEDAYLTEEETANISHLKVIFELDNEIETKIRNELTEPIFRERVKQAISDKRLDQIEKDALTQLAGNLKLSEEQAHTIYTEESSKFFKDYMYSIVANERLSPDEDKEIQATASSLGINLTYDEPTKQLLEKFRLLWLIENEELPEIESAINLQHNEKCYFSGDVVWYEYRRRLKGISYSGPTLRVRIAKGLYWRWADLGVRTTSDDTLSPIDSGPIYLTNKRLIFMGKQKDITIGLSKIVDFKPYRNGVEIHKDAGKNPFLQFDKDVDIFCVMLGRVIKDLG